MPCSDRTPPFCLSSRLPAPVRVRLEVQLATAPIGYVGVELGRGEIGVSEHLLDRAEVRAALQQMRREGVPQQVRVDTLGLEAGFRGQPPQNQERACAREPAALR